ncbi:TetR/AcrR family transcriptional regulator [Bacillus sp. DNRA2]|uniref:TetR/AcrR family transcriptional regulator n=1 Tax=Bacillus sp. DNRA2 TaxID=2723053 RepID=UPI001B7D1BCD|nr:TetR/AcrR family transcriptional regulator [Bacillus sp. DNRA2]
MVARERKFSTMELFQATEQTLLQHGYEGFTFGILAEKLKVSRGAIYKYYQNKEELIFDYMIAEMETFLKMLSEIEQQKGFSDQFDFLVDAIFAKTEIHALIEVTQHIPVHNNENVKEKKAMLDQFHLDMYKFLQKFIDLGRAEGILKPNLPDGMMLGFIFQSFTIPNHFGIPRAQWIRGIKEILGYGMFENK